MKTFAEFGANKSVYTPGDVDKLQSPHHYDMWNGGEILQTQS